MLDQATFNQTLAGPPLHPLLQILWMCCLGSCLLHKFVEHSTAGMYSPLCNTVVEVGMDCGNRAGVPPAYEYLELTLNVGGTVAAISPCTHSMLHAACNALEWGFLWIFAGLSGVGHEYCRMWVRLNRASHNMVGFSLRVCVRMFLYALPSPYALLCYLHWTDCGNRAGLPSFRLGARRLQRHGCRHPLSSFLPRVHIV